MRVSTTSARVTRLDLAVDDLLHPVHSFVPFRRLCNVSGIYTSWCGQKGTIYLGSKLSPLQFANYDKARQLLETGGQPQFQIQTRLEARYRYLGISPSQIATTVQNAFVRLEIADLAKAYAACSCQKWKDFLAWCSSVGSCKALAQLPSKSVRSSICRGYGNRPSRGGSLRRFGKASKARFRNWNQQPPCRGR